MTCDCVVDLSHWQEVDFPALKAGGCEAVILKATQGSGFVDDTYSSRLVEAREAGLLVGAYHFADATKPADQVAHFLKIAGDVDVLALDVEHNTTTGDTVTIPQAAEMAARLQMATRRLPLVYMGRYGPDGKGTGLPNSTLSRCPLWLAAYVSRPICPPGWRAWTFWQYTDGTSGPNCKTTPGVGACDRDMFIGSVDRLRAWWTGMS